MLTPAELSRIEKRLEELKSLRKCVAEEKRIEQETHINAIKGAEKRFFH